MLAELYVTLSVSRGRIGYQSKELNSLLIISIYRIVIKACDLCVKFDYVTGDASFHITALRKMKMTISKSCKSTGNS
jgi:hypothetical protein